MKSAGSADSSGKDLSALAYALLESGNVLVIDVLDLVCAELANLSVTLIALTEGLLGLSLGLSLSLIVIHLTFLLLVLFCVFSEGEVVVVGHLLEFGSLLTLRRKGRSIAFGGIGIAESALCGGTLALGIDEADLVCNYVCCVALLTLIVGPGACLDISDNAD